MLEFPFQLCLELRVTGDWISFDTTNVVIIIFDQESRLQKHTFVRKAD